MSRLFRAGAVPTLGLSLILLGPLAGCGGNANEPAEAESGEAESGEALPPAGPGQTEIPDTGAGATEPGDEGGSTGSPVESAPEEPGAGS